MTAAETVILEVMALPHLERKCAALSERVNSRSTEMVSKLHKMGYGEPIGLSCLVP